MRNCCERASCLRSSPRAWTRSFARGPSNPRGGLMACAAAPPRRISRGWRACHGVSAHCQRFMCERRTRSGAVVPKSQTTLPTTAHCQRVSSRWFATWAAPPRGVTSPTVNCGNCATRGPVRDLPAGDIATKRGNCTIRGATRRRHAEGRLLMLQNPHHYPWCHAPSLVQDCPTGVSKRR